MSPRGPRKPIPEWAQPARLMEALRKQQLVDPDTLFDTKLKTCSLNDVFAGMPPLPPPDPSQASVILSADGLCISLPLLCAQPVTAHKIVITG